MTTLTPDTRAVRAGLENCDVTGAVVPPLHLSSTYAFRGFGDKRKYDYSRSGNPTRDLLAEALADLEGGVGAVVTGSGMGAITLVGHLFPIGARVIVPHDCYGGTFRLLHRVAEARRARRGVRGLRKCGRGDGGVVEAGRDGLDRNAQQPAAAHHRRRGHREARACAWARSRLPTTLSCRRAGSSRSRSGPISWSTRLPSTSTATATWSAAR